MRGGIERFIANECLHPAILATGQSIQRTARPGLSLHAHRCHEVALVTGGSVVWTLDDAEYTVDPADVFFTKPGQVHGSCSAVVRPCTLTWIQIDVSTLDDAVLREQVERIIEPVWSAGGELLPHLRSVHRELRAPADGSRRIVGAELMLFLSKLVRSYRHARDGARGLPPLLVEMCRFVDRNAHRLVTVEDLVSFSGLSRSRVHALFREQLSQAPRDFIAERRLNWAARLLSGSSRTITDIALSLEFSSSQHLATAFRRRFGMTPREYRRSSAAGPTQMGTAAIADTTPSPGDSGNWASHLGAH